VPQVTDKDQIRSLLKRDARWCVYALGDLTPRMFDKCQWFTPDLTLVLHDYGTSILFADGTGSIREALDHVAWPVHLQVQSDALDEVRRHAIVTNERHMQRMTLERRTSIRVDPMARRLTSADAGALAKLYQDGEATGESPDFFYSSMVTDGVFFGVHEGDDLVAVAGTHLVARDEGAAAIGNVYVRRDRREHGLGRAVIAAVVHELRDLATVGLNVRVDNAAAIRVYESLGFAKHCDFREALATRAL
jgi:ribosomal protein S18 acetylase RimI-like enzyme